MNSRLAVWSGFLRLTPALPSQIYKECYLHVCVSKGSAEVEGKGEGGGRKEEGCIEIWPYKETAGVCQTLGKSAFANYSHCLLLTRWYQIYMLYMICILCHVDAGSRRNLFQDFLL